MTEPGQADHQGLSASLNALSTQFLPWNPWNFSYLQLHCQYGVLKVYLNKACEWFTISLGQLSYLIATGESCALQFCDYSSLKRLNWEEVLLQGGRDTGIDR